MRSLAKAAGVVAGIGAACFTWGLVEAQLFTVRRFTLPVLPPGGRDLKVLHVSDFHLLPTQHRKLQFIRSLSELEPDLIVNTGDNIASPEAIHALHVMWGWLRFKPGVFVFGSNDYYGPRFKNPLSYVRHRRSTMPAGQEPPPLPTDLLRSRFEDNDWVDLTHRRHIMEVGGYLIEFRGTDDAHLDQDDYTSVAGPPSDDVDLSIGVTHAPYLRLLDAMTADGTDLILAGHTHGGQVCVPGYGALTTNCDLDTGRVKGVSTHTADGRTTHLHVSAGVGTSPFAPFRFACRPEVSLLTLTSTA
ncbi:MAG: metallophosphoesterase [Propionibacterium sp.]|nr:metallophosphoesterase [Propionibacterium sp.]